MKIITRYDKKIKDVVSHYTYCVYLLEDNNTPLEVFTANNDREKHLICENLMANYDVTFVKHTRSFNIDLSSTPEYNEQ